MVDNDVCGMDGYDKGQSNVRPGIGFVMWGFDWLSVFVGGYNEDRGNICRGSGRKDYGERG